MLDSFFRTQAMKIICGLPQALVCYLHCEISSGARSIPGEEDAIFWTQQRTPHPAPGWERERCRVLILSDGGHITLGEKRTRAGPDFCTASSPSYSSAACNSRPAHRSLLALGTAPGSQAARASWSVQAARKATCS